MQPKGDARIRRGRLRNFEFSGIASPGCVFELAPDLGELLDEKQALEDALAEIGAEREEARRKTSSPSSWRESLT